ncbi:MAG: radical SAM protein [Fibrobacter sp.]|nr:radical SAM protein [Fibrobacter sp.]
MDYNLWYQNNYHLLSGHGLWLRGGEINTLEPQQFEQRRHSILITRLSTWRDTLESFTHKLLYQSAVKDPDFYADMAFLPPPSDTSVFDRDQIPWLLGTSSKAPASSFSMLAISLSIVQELVNLPLVLRKSGIPMSKKERLERPDIPLVILGGASALYTSSLLSDDPLVDGIFAGEEIDNIEKLFHCLKTGRSKKETLEHMETVGGFFQPENRERITTKVSAPLLKENLFLSNASISNGEEQAGKGNLQISEGCPSFCSFCAESFSRKPYREFTVDTLVRAASEMKKNMGLHSVELYSFNFNMHSDFPELLAQMCRLFENVKLKSQRFDLIADNPEILPLIHAAGKSSITCGLEGISGRLRRYLHKSLDNYRLRSSLSLLLRAPIRELKIFLIATGLENEEDFSEYKDLLTFICESMSSAGRHPRVIFSMTPLVRFPFTPLEKEPGCDPSVYREVMLQVERISRSRGFEFRSSASIDDYALSQLLTRAPGSAVIEAIDEAAQECGFIYYEEVPAQFIEIVKKKLRVRGLDFMKVISGAEWTDKSRSPVAINVTPEFMEEASGLLSRFEDRGYCLGRTDEKGVCRGCGACKEEMTRDKIVSLRKETKYSVQSLKDMISKSRAQNRFFPFKISIDRSRRGVPKETMGSVLARALMLCDERLVEGFRGFRGSLTSGRLGTGWICGEDVLTLIWKEDCLQVLEEICSKPAALDKVNGFMRNWMTLQGKDSGTVSFSLEFRSPFHFDISPFLKENALKCTMTKSPEGVCSYCFTPQSLKKKIVESVKSRASSEETVVTVKTGQKFSLQEFMSSSFPMCSGDELVRIEVGAKLDPESPRMV